jgi:hypothetical protein
MMSESFEEHLNLVRKVLSTLKANGIKIKVQKCQFFQQQVTFLGHLLSREGIKKSPDFTKKISDYSKPKTVSELRQFLGLLNFLRKFVHNCSVISKPVSALIGGPKKQVLVWTDEMSASFEQLKEALLEDVCLSFPDYSEGASKLELFVDASSVGAGACLVRSQNGQYHTIGYDFMTFSPAQTRYSTIERELVAIRWGVQAFRAFVYDVSFLLYTDHKPLLYLHNMARDNS